MGLEADTAETAALLARACLALDRDSEADELCSESERLAGHALKAAIPWRTVRAQLLARGGDHNSAQRIAEEAVDIAERTDLLVDHGDACLALATVLSASGDTAGARHAAERASELYELKGATALAENARSRIGVAIAAVRVDEHVSAVEPDTACVRVLRTMEATLHREEWDEFFGMYAPDVLVESRRKIVGFTQADLPSSDWPQSARSFHTSAGVLRARMNAVLAVRGERLAVTRLELSNMDTSPGAPKDEVLVLFGMNDEGRIALQLAFDVDDVDAAMAELEVQHARYEQEDPSTRANEAENACARVVRRMESAWRNEDWREGDNLVAPTVHVENRRKIVGVARGDLSSTEWIADARQFREPGMVRHRSSVLSIRDERLALTKVQVSTVDSSLGAPQDEMLILYGIDDNGRIALQVTFDSEDVDAALAELDAQYARLKPAPTRPLLENSASRVDRRCSSLFAERRWEEIAALWADDVTVDDRRRGLRLEGNYDHATGLVEVQAIADLGVQTMTSVAVAIRGERLALCRNRYSGRDQRPEAFYTEVLRIIEIDSSERCVASLAFDLDDLDAALAELDARYLAGEAAPHAHIWSVVAGAYAALDRHEMPPTTPDWVNIDRQRLALMGPGDAAAHLRAAWEVLPDFLIHVIAVHRLTDLGAVVTWFASGTSQQGFDIEQQGIGVLMVDDDLINHFELFDDVDLEAALATFDELSRPAPRLENAASRVLQRFHARFAAQNWTAVAEMMAEDHYSDDRRRVIGAGIRSGRDSQVEDLQGMSVDSWTLTPDVIAIRGDRLLLYQGRVSGYGEQTEALQWELLVIVETNADERITAWLVFDRDDIAAAFHELDTRYAAGEAAAYEETWSTISEVYAGFNRQELPATTPKWIYRDRRAVISTKAKDLAAYIDSAWDATPDLSIHVEAVHRLSDFGAVVTHTASGTNREGFGVEWRMIHIYTVDGTMISRCEMFDEQDLDAALARFDELHPSELPLKNAASQVYERLWNLFATGEWRAVTDLFTEDISNDDRRRVVNAGIEYGRDIQLENLRRLADIGATISAKVVATRGDRLILNRFRTTNSDLRLSEFDSEMLTIIETNVDGRIAAGALFDPDNIDAAFAELDARYLAGEAAPHSRTWRVITEAYAGMTRGELPPTTADLVNIDHRHGTPMGPDDGIAHLDASWRLAEGFTIYIEAVHRLSDFGAVFTRSSDATSKAGFDAEWRAIDLVTVDGDRISRGEIFGESDLDAALAKFEGLHPSAHPLENAATRVYGRYTGHFAARDWDTLIQMLAEDHRSEDRRPVANEGSRHGREAEIENLKTMADLGVISSSVHLATRGDRLALCRVLGTAGESFELEVLRIVEIDAEERMVARVVFSVDDLDAACEELDARYLAGQAATCAHTWSAITKANAVFNRREMFATTADWVNIDHRRVTGFAPGDQEAYVRATWDLAPDVKNRIVAVHRASHGGAVFTQALSATSRESFEAEWREVVLLMINGDAISRCEVFDEPDLDTALARFDELNQLAPQLENAATRTNAPIADAFNRRDLEGYLGTVTADARCDDRRKGLRHEDAFNAEFVRGLLAEAPEGWRLAIDPIAIRNQRLALSRHCYCDAGDAEGPIAVEALVLTEVDDAQLIYRAVVFDTDDVSAAFAELDARYVAGEAAAYARTWAVIVGAYAALNRHELPALSPDCVNVDHRRATAMAPGELIANVQASWDIAPDLRSHVEAVHRLTARGAVVTWVADGTSKEAFKAEWRAITVLIVDGELVSRVEVFDEADLGAAVVKFDELDGSDRR